MSDIEKNFMTRFDSLVARHRNEIENEAAKEIAVTESPPVSLSLKSVEEEQERIMRKVYGNTSDHVNYNQNIKAIVQPDFAHDFPKNPIFGAKALGMFKTGKSNPHPMKLYYF